MNRTLLVLAWLACGCAPVDVTGDWEGSWTTDLNIATGGIRMSLDQIDEDVDGTTDLSGTLCVPTGDFEGDVLDHDFRGSFTNGVGRVELDGTISRDQLRISGDFEVTAGLCDGWHGTFELERD